MEVMPAHRRPGVLRPVSTPGKENAICANCTSPPGARDLELYHQRSAERRDCASYYTSAVLIVAGQGYRLPAREPLSRLFRGRRVGSLEQAVTGVAMDVSAQEPGPASCVDGASGHPEAPGDHVTPQQSAMRRVRCVLGPAREGRLQARTVRRRVLRHAQCRLRGQSRRGPQRTRQRQPGRARSEAEKPHPLVRGAAPADGGAPGPLPFSVSPPSSARATTAPIRSAAASVSRSPTWA